MYAAWEIGMVCVQTFPNEAIPLHLKAMGLFANPLLAFLKKQFPCI